MERVGQVLVETYRVERLMAEGGMASVYEARHVRVPKRFAVKFLRHQLANHAEALARFRREAEIIATLEHPNIVQLVDYNVSDDGLPYIVLEFLDGESLGARMDRGRMDLVETLKIAQKVAAALEAAHARDVTHRDLKPENIFLTHDGQVKVLDFGVAKLRKAPELTAMNVVVGTVGYMSPEQISGQPVDPRTDQFALASIIYAMLAGQPAFEIDGPVVLQATRILQHIPPEIEGVSQAVNAALKRGMAKNAFERYATVGELVESLIAAAGATVAQRISQEFDVAPTTDPVSELASQPTRVTEEEVITQQGNVLVPEPEALQAERTMITPVPAGASAEPPTDPTALVDEGGPVTVETMPAVTGEIDAHAALRATLERPTEPDESLPAQKTQLVAQIQVGPVAANGERTTVPASERVTLKPMQAPPELQALRDRARSGGRTGDDTSKQLVPRGSSRLAWILLGAAAGGGVATIVYLLFSH